QGATCGPRRPAQSVTLRTSVPYSRPRVVGRPCHVKGTLVSCVWRPVPPASLWQCGPRKGRPSSRVSCPMRSGCSQRERAPHARPDRRLAGGARGGGGRRGSSRAAGAASARRSPPHRGLLPASARGAGGGAGGVLDVVAEPAGDEGRIRGRPGDLGGEPGFSCSDARPCRGTAPFKVGVNVSWQVELDKTDERYVGKGWQHLKRYWVRSARGEMSQVEGWEVAPAVSGHPAGAQEAEEAAALLQRFLRDDLKVTADDVMVIGLLGNHFNDGDLPAFERYAELLMRDVVTEFPGRVVVLGTSPQHFRTQTGAYNVSQGATGCAPIPLPSDASGGNNKNRNAIWGHSVWRHMKSKRARFVDMYEMLLPLWRCHRNELDCTHWSDAVISIQVELVLEALKKIE
ncbi:unnamed protein product, partial [Prorocentrum cordatum]